MSLTADLLKEMEPGIASIELIPSQGGVFEVEVNGDLVFSKKATARHAEEGEILKLVQARAKSQ